MKINVGIRRRLAPLLDNGRDEIELMHAILFSLPGSPGPLLRRRDRDGRQRLPRRPRRRAHADAVDRRPQRRLLARRLRPALRAAADGPGLRLPGGQRRGPAAHADLAAALAASASSRCARSTRSSASARYEPLRAEQPARSSPTSARYEDDVVLCVHNLARSAQAVELDLSALRGPLARGDVRAHALPARSASCPYLLTLAPRGLLLVPAQGGPRRRHGADRWQRADLAALDEEQLAEWLLDQRWFGSKAREVAHDRTCSTSSRCDDGPPRAVASRSSRRASRPGTHDALPAAARRVGGDGCDEGVIDDVDGVDGLRRARRPATRARLLGGLLRERRRRSTASTRASSSTGSTASSRRGPTPTCARSAPSSPTPRSSSTTRSC